MLIVDDDGADEMEYIDDDILHNILPVNFDTAAYQPK